MDESNHVSSTSVSEINSDELHFGHLSIFGGCVRGSIGTQSSSARIVSLHFLQYHMGIGVAKTRCLEMTQSQSSDLAQSIRRVLMYSGYHLISQAFFSIWSVSMRAFMNH